MPRPRCRRTGGCNLRSMKGADKQKKLQKKKAQKTLKEKRADKRAAKNAKTH